MKVYGRFLLRAAASAREVRTSAVDVDLALVLGFMVQGLKPNP